MKQPLTYSKKEEHCSECGAHINKTVQSARKPPDPHYEAFLGNFSYLSPIDRFMLVGPSRNRKRLK